MRRGRRMLRQGERRTAKHLIKCPFCKRPRKPASYEDGKTWCCKFCLMRKRAGVEKWWVETRTFQSPSEVQAKKIRSMKVRVVL